MKANKRTRVFKDEAGREAARLGEKGFSTQFIMARTGLSAGQVTYRLGIAGICRADYRNGRSLAARKVAALPGSKRLLSKLDRFTKDFDAYEAGLFGGIGGRN